MSISQAIINPARGTIAVTVGSADEGTDLPTRHALAPWPVDEYCEQIAVEALSGMGWSVIGGGRSTADNRDPEAAFVLDVAPTR